MSIDTGSDYEMAVDQMDYLRLLRESEAAFARGDMHEGQRFLDMAASYEKKLIGAGEDSPRDPGREA